MKAILAIVVALIIFSKYDVPSSAISQTLQPTIRADGDSFGVYGSRPNNNFIERVARSKKLSLTNASVSGSVANDVWHKVSSEIVVPTTYQNHIINIGFNDVRKYGNLPYIDQDVKNKIRNIVAYLRLGSISDNGDSGITYFGKWDLEKSKNGDFYGNTVSFTNDPHAYAEYTFSGDKVTIGTFGVNSSTAGILEIKVDGRVLKTFNESNQSISTPNQYANNAIEITNIGVGSHVLTVSKSDEGTGNIHLDWVGIPSDNPPVVLVNGLTKMKKDEYTNPLRFPNVYANDQIIDQTNKAIREALSDFDEKVIFVDQSDYNPNEYNLLYDGVHPNDLGHEWLASNILKRWSY